MKKPLVIVEWLDAHANQMTLFTEGEIPHAPTTAYTAGWLIKDDAVGVSLANEFFVEDETWRGTTFIPRAMVKTVTQVKGRRRRMAAGAAPPREG